MVFGEKIKLKFYVNQHDSVSDIQIRGANFFRWVGKLFWGVCTLPPENLSMIRSNWIFSTKL
jgi:hypothetical protein